MTFNEKRIAKKFAKKMIKKTIKYWLHSDNFNEWFWDYAHEYALREDEIDYITKNLKKWVDKQSTP